MDIVREKTQLGFMYLIGPYICIGGSSLPGVGSISRGKRSAV